MKKNPPKAGRPHQSQIAPGVFKRGAVFWLRYSVGGEQIRVSLETSDPAQALLRANEARGRAVPNKAGRVRGGKTPMDRALEKYLESRLRDPKFGDHSAGIARRSVARYVAVMGATDPNEITTRSLVEFYQKLNGTWVPKHKSEKIDATWKQSESTAQTYSARVATFATFLGLRVTYPTFAEKPSREVIIHKSRVAELLELAAGDLKFILFCGFRAGMRRGEIAMARPAWFDLASGKIRIPGKDTVTGFQPKGRKARTLPLGASFRDFILAEYPDWHTRAFCIRPAKPVGKWIYRFDFRKLFVAFTKKNCPELTPHVMRHSYASHLANAGIGMAQLSAWTGDEIATLARHYLHLEADAEKAEDAFSAHKNLTARQAQAAMAEKMAWVQELLTAQAAQDGLISDHYTSDGVDDGPVKPRTRGMIDY